MASWEELTNAQLFDLHQLLKPVDHYHHLTGHRRRIMRAPAAGGIEPEAGVLPQFSLQHVTALRRCEDCQSKKACRTWLDYAPAMVKFCAGLL
jgi:hypothetical protein